MVPILEQNFQTDTGQQINMISKQNLNLQNSERSKKKNCIDKSSNVVLMTSSFPAKDEALE